MLFVKNDDLKVGMRLAKPIYNKKGVLLYDRDSKLSLQGIDSVKNFGLIGLYILEPAEPLPPMTEEDIEFERYQTVAVFQLQDELEIMNNQRKASKMRFICEDVIRHYGRLNKKINFVQNLRSSDDYTVKHSLNCAILCAMMSHVLNIPIQEQTETVMAALVHDVGKLNIPKDILDKKAEQLTQSDHAEMDRYEREGAMIIEDCFSASPGVKRIVTQCYRMLGDFNRGREQSQAKTVTGAKILAVAETFDTMTAMNDYREPSSEIAALRHLMNNPSVFDEKVVNALVKSITFLANGCCVELNNGDKGLVITANDDNVLCPMVLCFSNNSIVDLSREGKAGGLEIKDVMKTMDNRCVVDKEMLKKFGN